MTIGPHAQAALIIAVLAILALCVALAVGGCLVAVAVALVRRRPSPLHREAGPILSAIALVGFGTTLAIVVRLF